MDSDPQVQRGREALPDPAAPGDQAVPAGREGLLGLVRPEFLDALEHLEDLALLCGLASPEVQAFRESLPAQFALARLMRRAAQEDQGCPSP